MVNIQKAAVIGCGFVGSTIAYTLMQKGLFSEWYSLMQTRRRQKERRWISATDCRLHMQWIFMRVNMRILQMRRSLLLRQGQTRNRERRELDLVQKNAAIMRSIIKEIKRVNCEGILLIVSNPVDILTEVALRESGFPKERVIGSGTVLDTARLKYISVKSWM